MAPLLPVLAGHRPTVEHVVVGLFVVVPFVALAAAVRSPGG